MHGMPQSNHHKSFLIRVIRVPLASQMPQTIITNHNNPRHLRSISAEGVATHKAYLVSR